jgi:hypothetical protein
MCPRGVQEALHYVGGAPKVHGTDSLSAAFKNLSERAKDDLCKLHKAFVEHYNMEPTRINPKQSHEMVL